MSGYYVINMVDREILGLHYRKMFSDALEFAIQLASEQTERDCTNLVGEFSNNWYYEEGTQCEGSIWSVEIRKLDSHK